MESNILNQNKICLECGKPFNTGSTYWKLFCESNCNKKYYNKKSRAKKNSKRQCVSDREKNSLTTDKQFYTISNMGWLTEDTLYPPRKNKSSKVSRFSSLKTFFIPVVILFLSLVYFKVNLCFAFEITNSPECFNKIVDTIYWVEGGAKAKVPYGILSVKVSSKEEARRVCYNTVRNNYFRWLKSDRKKTYLKFLADRYCPVGAENDNGTNKYWLRNLERLLNK